VDRLNRLRDAGQRGRRTRRTELEHHPGPHLERIGQKDLLGWILALTELSIVGDDADDGQRDRLAEVRTGLRLSEYRDALAERRSVGPEMLRQIPRDDETRRHRRAHVVFGEVASGDDVDAEQAK